MFGSPLLGTAIGLVLLFATTALLCSGITESVSNHIELRAKYLLIGLRSMLDEPEAASAKGTSKDGNALHEAVKDLDATKAAAKTVRDGFTNAKRWIPVPDGRSGTKIHLDPVLTKALFASPLLSSLQSRRVGFFKKGTLRNPQYVSGRTFARALVDLLVPAPDDGKPPIVVDIATIRTAIEKLPPQMPVRRQLLVFLATAGTDVAAFETSLENWYDEQMAKISGWYKRWSRVALGIVGLVIAGLANIDTLQVAHSLYVDAPLQQAVVAAADSGSLCQDMSDPGTRRTCATNELDALQVAGVPIGWPDARLQAWPDWVLKVVGMVVTAFAVSFGAPFWFEALSKLGSLRTAGKRPDDK
jgi:hypothetical protein